MKTKFPQTMVVLACISSEIWIDIFDMLPHIFQQGLRLNSNDYVKLLSIVVKPWLVRVASGRLSAGIINIF